MVIGVTIKNVVIGATIKKCGDQCNDKKNVVISVTIK